MAEKLKHDKMRIYIPSLAMRLLILIAGLLITAMHALVLRQANFVGAGDFPLLFVVLILMFDAAFLWWGIVFTTQTRVIVSEIGIELQRGTARLFTPWDNISHFGVKGAGKNQQRGLFLYDKVQPQVSGIADKLFFGWETNFMPIGQVVNLPTHWGFFRQPINLDKVLQTEFGQDVAYYAPHLFDEAKDRRKSKAQPDWLSSLADNNESFYIGSDSNHQKEKR